MITIFKTFIGIHMSTNMKLRFIQVWTTINFLKNMDKLFVVNIEKYISPFDLPLFLPAKIANMANMTNVANLSCKLNAKPTCTIHYYWDIICGFVVEVGYARRPYHRRRV